MGWIVIVYPCPLNRKEDAFNEQTSHGPWGSAGLKMTVQAQFFRRAILTHKVDHICIVFGLLSMFISRSVYARLQISVCSGYDLFNLVSIQTHTQTHRQHFDRSLLASWARMHCDHSLVAGRFYRRFSLVEFCWPHWKEEYKSHWDWFL